MMKWLSQYIPVLDWARNYERNSFKYDLIAGITVGIILIPQGMAYAWIAGLPPEYGLYASLLPGFIYSLLGTARYLSVGPVAMDSLIVATSISAMAVNSTEEYIALAILLAFMVGALQLIFGLVKLGFIVNFLSRPVIIGFTSAAAIIIAFNQFKYVFGVDIPRNTQIQLLVEDLWKSMDSIHFLTMASGCVAIILSLVMRAIDKRIPWTLILLVFGTVLVYSSPFFRELAVVGNVPAGLPEFKPPRLNWADFTSLLPAAFALAVVGITEATSIAKASEEKSQDAHHNADQELVAIGTSNLIGSFFQSFVVTASYSRSAVYQTTGNKTHLAQFISAIMILVTLLFLTDLFYYLPEVILATIIIVAVFGLVAIKPAINWWKTDKREFFLYAASLVVTMTVGIMEGIVVGVLLSLLMLILRATKPHMAVVGKIQGEGNIYRNVKRFANVTVDPEIMIVRFDESLFYANVGYFRERLIAMEKERKEQITTIIINGSGINSVDATAIYELKRMLLYYNKRQIKILFAELKGPVRDAFRKYHLYRVCGEENFFVNVENAVAYSKGLDFEAKGKIARQSNPD
jgi:sulfate permease, SulP family